ncbi:hypothetical protein [Streptomyces sp. URMC 123]|uniref:hypothetical protein n=1 Tax=Streptomyces sp. URMC 123 TaxID=3423403 RepID=UPI003F199D04
MKPSFRNGVRGRAFQCAAAVTLAAAALLALGGPATAAPITGPSVEATHPLFGETTIKLPDVDVSPASILQPTGPGGLVSTMLTTFDITFER